MKYPNPRQDNGFALYAAGAIFLGFLFLSSGIQSAWQAEDMKREVMENAQ